MQIHELNSFIGSPTSTDYLAIDDGAETFKISLKDSVDEIIADDLPSMTQAEAEAGTSTSKKTITPKVFHDAIISIAKTISDTWVNVTTPKYNLNTAAAAGTVDGDLYAAITALNWQSDVID